MKNLNEIREEHAHEAAKILIDENCEWLGSDRTTKSIPTFFFKSVGLAYRMEVFGDNNDIVICLKKEDGWHQCNEEFSLMLQASDYLRQYYDIPNPFALSNGAVEWVSVEERLPEAGGLYLVHFIKHSNYFTRVIPFTGEKFMWRGQKGRAIAWQPLPAPPIIHQKAEQ